MTNPLNPEHQPEHVPASPRPKETRVMRDTIDGTRNRIAALTNAKTFPVAMAELREQMVGFDASFQGDMNRAEGFLAKLDRGSQDDTNSNVLALRLYRHALEDVANGTPLDRALEETFIALRQMNAFFARNGQKVDAWLQNEGANVPEYVKDTVRMYRTMIPDEYVSPEEEDLLFAEVVEALKPLTVGHFEITFDTKQTLDDAQFSKMSPLKLMVPVRIQDTRNPENYVVPHTRGPQAALALREKLVRLQNDPRLAQQLELVMPSSMQPGENAAGIANTVIDDIIAM